MSGGERHVLVPPRPGPMVEALRGLGYSPGAALADLIDNAISAGARHVDVRVQLLAGGPRLMVLDDGHGMDREGLIRAMRLGELDPRDQRSATDLGRFGLGLKTASFSQCRRLTVVSRAAGEVSCFRWDLERLSREPEGGWRLLVGPDPESVDLMDVVPGEHGTAVVWEDLDRLHPPGSPPQALLDVLDQVERHLSAVFHRFLGPGAEVQPPLDLRIQGRPVAPWDPFMQGHPSTQALPAERIARSADGADVWAQGYVLPHRDRLSEEEWRDGGGVEGWVAQQGFYVYRNRRLLVSGGWLGLGPARAWAREEAHQLARLRIDLPNAADAEWSIDVRKSRARPPRGLQPLLRQLAEDARKRARRVYAHRTAPVARVSCGPIASVWESALRPGGGYRVNRDHPAVQAILASHPGVGPALKALLALVEDHVPVQRMWLDRAEGREPPRPLVGEPAPAVLRETLAVLHRLNVVEGGMSPDASRLQLLSCEPFHAFPDLVAALPDDPGSA
jgi:hypothetical protein